MKESSQDVWSILREYCLGSQVSNSDVVRDVCVKFRDLFKLFQDTRIKCEQTSCSGIGIFALSDIPCGEVILVDHPVVSLLDVELGVSSFFNVDGGDSMALLEKLSMEYNEAIESCLLKLHPIRSGSSLSSQSTDSCHPSIVDRMRHKLPSLMTPEIVLRAVQLNSLGYYTFPELCTYNEHLRFLSGTGLYPTASNFNHSCDPNVHHYSLGDVAFFRTIRDVRAGEELFITYIGRDLLCETKSVRDEFLDSRDFVCQCTKCLQPDLEDPWCEELDLETRIAIHMAPTKEDRISIIRTLLANHTYINRDKIDLQFTLCRALGNNNHEEWASLLEKLDQTDLLYVVVAIHFMKYFGHDAQIAANIARTSQICLGESDIMKLFEFTDFQNFIDL